MTDTPIDFRLDGSIVFDLYDVTIRWQPPTVNHLQEAKNRNRELALATQELVGQKDDPTFDSAAFTVAIDDLAAGWVRAVHDDLRLEGDLPPDIGDWPYWLPTLRFSTKLIEHWGTHPFAWNTTDNDQTETVP